MNRPFSLAALPGPVAGAIMMVCASTCFSIMNLLIRHAADLGMHPFQIAFFRSLFSFLTLLPFLGPSLIKEGFSVFRTRRPGLLLLRGVSMTLAMGGWMMSVALMPLAEATALTFSSPLFATIGSALILKEIVRARRWFAIAIGFIGVLVIIRPGSEVFSLVALVPMATALAMGTSAILIKALSSSDKAWRLVFLTSIIVTFMTLPFAIAFWTPMTPERWLYAVLIGAGGSATQVCLAKAFEAADATLVLPWDYMRLPLTALLAYIAFAEVPPMWTWIGAGIICGSAFYIAHREARLARKVTKPVA